MVVGLLASEKAVSASVWPSKTCNVYPALLQPKAEALKEELKRQFPHSKVDALTKSAFDDPALFGAELIIDATGEEAVSEYLNELSLVRKLSTAI